MAKTNLSLGNLYRATQGTTRTTQEVSLNAMNASLGAGVAFSEFAINSVTINPPTYTYIVESTSENATFTFSGAGAKFATRVGSIPANYTVTFDNANFSVGSPTLGASPSFPITPTSIAVSNYSEASATLTMKYEDGYNVNATNYNSSTTKLLYAVDVYNTINEPDFCLLFGTKIQLANGSEINVEDLSVGDEIKAWVPAGLPDEAQTDDSATEWRFYHSDELNGTSQNVTVRNITFNFAAGYFSINNGLIKATETHPLYVWDNEIGKYKFKNVGDILPGDRLVLENETEVDVTNIQIITEDVEIVTVDVENADVYISNGLISHNKGTTTQPSIPASGLRMYLDPSKNASTSRNDTSDWLDLTGYGTGFRPAAQSPFSVSGANPSYNNGANRNEQYYSLDGGDYFAKDRSSNISGGATQFDTTALTYITWFRASSFLNGFDFISKDGATIDYRFGLITLASVTALGFTWTAGANTSTSGINITVSPNIWYQAAITISTVNGIQRYVDTTILNGGSAVPITFTGTSSYNIYLGNKTQSGTYQQGPALFYNRVLTSNEITRVYNHFSPTYK